MTENILVGCECSGVFTSELRKKGFHAWSCDLSPALTSHPCPEYHIQGDIFKVFDDLRPFAVFAFPPCTHLATSGARWRPQKARLGLIRSAFDFFKRVLSLPVDYIMVENPLGIVSSQASLDRFLPGESAIPYSQITSWDFFGSPLKKKTCLWIRGFPKLVPTSLSLGRRFVDLDFGSRDFRRSLSDVCFASAVVEQFASTLCRAEDEVFKSVFSYRGVYGL